MIVDQEREELNKYIQMNEEKMTNQETEISNLKLML